MKTYRVIYSPRAARQLEAIFEFVEGRANARVAMSYVKRLKTKCDTLKRIPERGLIADEVSPDLRIMSIAKRAVVAFTIDHGSKIVTVQGVFAGGQDYERALKKQ